jgi:hypothetical protein
MKSNDQPRKTLFDIVMQNSSVKQKEEPTPAQTSPKASPFFILGLIAGFFVNALFLYLGLGVLSAKIDNFPAFSYIDSLKLYTAAWVILSLIRKK